MSLKTCSSDRARALAVQLDAAFAEIAMLAETNWANAPQLDAMLREVIASHSAKLDRVAAAGKTDLHFDGAKAAHMDLRIAWAYRLLDAQGSAAVVRDEDRTAMCTAGLTDADAAFVDQHLALLQANYMVPTPRGKLAALVERYGAAPTPMNLASAQQIYFRGLSLALFEASRRYAGEVPDAENIVAAALRVDRVAGTPASAPSLPMEPGPRVVCDAPIAVEPVIDDDIVAVGEKLIAVRAKDESWDAKTQKQARQIYKLTQRFMVEVHKLDGGLASLNQKHFASLVKFLRDEIYKHHGKSERDHNRSISELRKIASNKPKALRGLDGPTLNRHLGNLRQLLKHGQAQGIPIDREIEFVDLRSHKKNSGRARDKRPKMPVVVTTRVFHAPPSLGCLDWDSPYEPGDLVFHRALYFVPMMLEYTGTRREETCGLCVDDVYAEGPIPYIRIRPNEFRRIKNPQSLRDIPLHPELLRLNFKEYVDLIRALGYRRVFPDLYSPTSNSPLGDRFYDEFMPVLEWACKTEKVELEFVLHSIRHGFNSRLKAALVHAEERADLMGHGGDSETTERYADPILLQRALDVLNKLPIVTAQLQPKQIRLLPWVERKEIAPFSRGARLAPRLRKF